MQYGDFANVDQPLFCYRIYDSHTKQIIKRNKEQYDAWMLEIFHYAWTTRGFDVDEKDVKFIYYYLYGCKQIWKIDTICKALGFLNRVTKKSQLLELSEKDEIIAMTRNRLYILIPYLYPLRVMNRIIKRLG